MKKTYVILIIMILSIFVNAQNKIVAPAGQKGLLNEDETTVIKKSLNSLSNQVKNLQTKVSSLTNENNKKIGNFSENIKSMNDKVNAASETTAQLSEDLSAESKLGKTRFDNTSYALQKLKYFSFIVFFLIALFVIIVTYYFNSTLNKNVNLINESIHKIKENINKQFSEFKDLNDKLIKENTGLLENKIKITEDSFHKKLEDNKGLLMKELNKTETKFSGEISNLNVFFNNTVKDSIESLNNKILKNAEDTKVLIDNQIALLKNNFEKELKQHKHIS